MKLLLACLLLSVGLYTVSAGIPKFSQSYSVQETDEIRIHQGNYVSQGNSVCCPVKSAGCKVQVEETAGQNYVDAENQRTRFDPFGSEQSIVTLYKEGKQYSIQNNTCQYYCPLQNDDFPTFGPSPNATLVGTKVINGKKCNDYNWKETILGIVVMEISDFFSDPSTSPPTPVQETDQITPFGQKLGTSNAIWANFKAGVPPATLWTEIKGLKDCPQYNQCNQNSAMMNSFLRQKLFKTWAYHRFGTTTPPMSDLRNTFKADL